MGQNWRAPFGLTDWWGEQSRQIETWRRHFVEVAGRAGYEPIDVPLFELSHTYEALPGPQAPAREVYRFVDVGGDDLTLRWSFVAQFQRAAIQHAWHLLPHPVRVFASGPLLRRLAPDAGEYRQWTAFSLAAYGPSRPWLLIDVMGTLAAGLARLGRAVSLVLIPPERQGDFPDALWRDRIQEAMADAHVAVVLKERTAAHEDGASGAGWFFQFVVLEENHAIVVAEGGLYPTPGRSDRGEPLVLAEGHCDCTALARRWSAGASQEPASKPVVVFGGEPRALALAHRLRQAGLTVKSLFDASVAAVPEGALAAVAVDSARPGIVRCLWPSGQEESLADDALVERLSATGEDA
ncbi:MAG: ATP phosphoribosyltransferase regulatory subunit [Firmicutes bacterium]|nr:ATP phosphoribosyltransferase regulatory subunit [Bacillota bacterium]